MSNILSMFGLGHQEDRETKDKYDAVNRTQAIIEFDMAGNILTANDNFLDLMDYGLSEVVGRHHSIFVDHADKNSSEYKTFWERLNRGERIVQDFRRVGKNGKDIWVYASYNPLIGDDGRPYKVIKFANDITSQKIQSSENLRIKQALDVCDTSVMMADEDLNIIYMNKAVEEMLKEREATLKSALPNFSSKTLMGTCVDDFHQNPAHQRGLLSDLKEPHSTELSIAGLTFGLIATPLFNENGNRFGTVVEWVDKTERLAAEEELAKQAAANLRIKQALDVCDTSVMMADEDLNIIYMNVAVEKMLQDREDTLKTALPNFSSKTLMGTCVDDFHQDPRHQRGLLGGLTKQYSTNLSVAGLTFGLIATPLFDEEGNRLGTVVEWNDKTERLAAEAEEAEKAAANLRIKQALDVCNTSVMMADEDLNIIYMNTAVEKMLHDREDTLRTALPNFNSKSLMGTCVDDFHKNPAHQRGLLGSLTKQYSTNLSVADLTFGLIATPLFDEEGNRLGTVVEWNDKTERLAAEAEEAEKAAANLRIRQALDVCNTSVMLADTDLNIIYTNKAVQQMMSDRQAELREELPQFDASKLIGTCVDDFHKNPNHQRGLLESLKTPYRATLEVAGLTFGLIASPLSDDNGVRLGTVVEWEDKTKRLAAEREEQRISAENARVKQALDSVSANVMIADPEFNIIYMNSAVRGMMRTAETDIRKDLPGFDTTKLLGANVDIFHKNPSHQRNMVAGLSSTFNSEISVGGRTFLLTASPILVEGNRLGTVVEWVDRSSEVAIEKEIDGMVEAASSGDFSKTVNVDDKEGFFLKLSTGLNDLVGTVEVAMNDVIRMLGAMARGDLTERITREYEGSFGQLKTDANGTADKLTEILTKITSSSSAIASGANEIAQGNADLSQRTEEQASSLEETASSMEEMTSTVKQSADNAEQANNLAQEAQTKAQEGGSVVNTAIAAMEEINTSSKKIADIIGVIDEIAFQTNLLALNAAVEAARAGEQGRGFAVVAGEVRNLAQRSAAAAKEIKDLIRDSVDKVEDGANLVNKSGKTLEEIVASVENVTSMMEEISNAAREQTSGIEQVNKAISQMDEMTQQNAALVEEASAAGEAMADQARTMNEVVSFFTTSGSGGSARAASYGSPSPIKTYTSPTKQSSNASSGGDEWEDF